ncbi:tetratricopeptide (TPR) repeat protein [Streptomyces sp. B3I7]|uniref:tetratricopeptide repeat protein n=1 Tax=Streptomyces sp. B3I7 TaxID=3042269 RepID=UPI00277D1A3F|nr:tetratricopeptide (TPR) repeat protein [Streptomyces sp. B3I7]
MGDRGGEAYVYNEVGWTYSLCGEYDEAITQCLRAVAIHQQIGNTSGEAHALDKLGWAHHHLKQYPQALDYFGQALKLWRPMGDRHLMAETLVHIGETHLAAENPENTALSWRMALSIFQEFDHPDVEQLKVRLAQLDGMAVGSDIPSRG